MVINKSKRKQRNADYTTDADAENSNFANCYFFQEGCILLKVADFANRSRPQEQMEAS